MKFVGRSRCRVNLIRRPGECRAAKTTTIPDDVALDSRQAYLYRTCNAAKLETHELVKLNATSTMVAHLVASRACMMQRNITMFSCNQAQMPNQD